MISDIAKPITVEIACDYFDRFGGTDRTYLNAHFMRFCKTKEFVASPKSPKLTILDVGAHWLHNAFFYAVDGHKIHCVDSPNTMRNKKVIDAANELGCQLHIADHLEFGDGIKEIPTDTVDLVLFCEIIEHLAFNPIDLWKEIYRVLKAPGRIVVTTPNANFWPRLNTTIERISTGNGWGATVSEIISTGTFGHHWKEYTAYEIVEYFKHLSPDFRISKCFYESITFGRYTDKIIFYGKPSLTDEELRHDSIFAEITLDAKSKGITIEPPWRAKYNH